MGMLIKQGKGYTGAALARRRVEVASPRDPDRSPRLRPELLRGRRARGLVVATTRTARRATDRATRWLGKIRMGAVEGFEEA